MSEPLPDSGARVRGLVLVAEDEPAIADVIRLHLARAGYGVHLERTADGALAAARALRPAAIVLDIGLAPARDAIVADGLDLCRRLRAEQDWTPILFVSARGDEVDRTVGIELGADDYISKPFSPRELVARVGGVLRRANGVPSSTAQRVGEIVLDPAARRVFAAGQEVSLTATEFDLLAHLMRSPGRVASREQLLSQVWGYAAVGGTRTIDVHVAALRAKLGEHSPIRTVRGVGYSVEPSGR